MSVRKCARKRLQGREEDKFAVYKILKKICRIKGHQCLFCGGNKPCRAVIRKPQTRTQNRRKKQNILRGQNKVRLGGFEMKLKP